MKHLFIISIIASFFATSCSQKKIIDVKSPCVSKDDGPCGPKKPVNKWLEQQNNKQA